MRSMFVQAGFWLLSFVAGIALAQTSVATAPVAKAKTYALVAAIGDQFEIVIQGQNVGSHLDAYKRSRRTAPDNLLNMLALQSLDKVVAQLEPDSRRVYLTLPAAQVDRVASWNREDAVLAKLRGQLEKMPERQQWD